MVVAAIKAAGNDLQGQIGFSSANVKGLSFPLMALVHDDVTQPEV
jgi:hypothetical protein